MLLRIPEVQKELSLNDEQKDQINALLGSAGLRGQINFQDLQT